MTAATGFAGSIAIVTGAAGGIGAAVSAELLKRGAEVIGVDRDAGPAGIEHFVCGDLTTQATIDEVFVTAERVPGRLAVLVNCAFWEERAALESLTLPGWQRTLDVSLTVAMRTTTAFARAVGHGSAIVNVASVHAFGAAREFAAYEAAKAGMVALTRSAAVELAPRGTRCNAVAPGFIQVGRNATVWSDERRLERLLRSYPMGRPGTANEVARCVTFLASDDASFVTGAVLVVDGGMSAQLPEAIQR